jgi:hypothetical protein
MPRCCTYIYKFKFYNKGVFRLPLQAIEQVAAPDLPLLAATRQRARAINKPLSINTEHAHLGHRADKRRIPCALASREGVERNSGDRVLRNALVCWEGEGCFSAPCVGVVFVVPFSDSRVERSTGFRRV